MSVLSKHCEFLELKLPSKNMERPIYLKYFNWNDYVDEYKSLWLKLSLFIILCLVINFIKK